MKYLSRIFQPMLIIPKNAKVKSTEITCISQKLLLECGLIRPTSAGFFTLLPLARRALDKLEDLVRRSIESVGGQRISLPTLTASALWQKSGRLEACESELLTVEDRLRKNYVLAPTHEEAIADLLADVSPLTYKQLPLVLYQIGDKYRDELRPKHGLLRSRQFVMMDAYGAHRGAECASEVYERVTGAYSELFRRLKLNVFRVEAPSGEMGGNLSHEWHVRANAGEDQLTVCNSCQLTSLVSQTACVVCSGSVTRVNSIEIGHTFILGTKYSDALNAQYISKEGTNKPIFMSCYGIGLTRLLAASMESASADRIRWPTGIAPYTVVVIGPKAGSKEWSSGGWEKAQELSNELLKLPQLSNDILIDDRHNLTIGKRLLQAEKSGYPITVVCGRSSLATPALYEVRSEETTTNMTLEELLQFLNNYVK